jgi:hypothetical protein
MKAMNHYRTRISRWMALPALALILSACGLVAPAPTAAPPGESPTNVPTSAPPTASPVPPTATASPVPPTETPSPTPDASATAAAAATATAAPIIAKIDSELKQYGLSTSQGHLGWLHDPVTVNLDSYMAEDIETDYPDVSVTDFVMQADVTWNTTSGLAGCGFVLRAAPDFNHGDSYRFYTIRLGPLWDLEYYKNGKFYSNLTGIRDALPLDDGVDATNTVTAVVQGHQMGLYANGQELATVNDSRLLRGTPAFVGWQESGQTTCTFENGWLWVLND